MSHSRCEFFEEIWESFRRFSSIFRSPYILQNICLQIADTIAMPLSRRPKEWECRPSFRRKRIEESSEAMIKISINCVILLKTRFFISNVGEALQRATRKMQHLFWQPSKFGVSQSGQASHDDTI